MTVLGTCDVCKRDIVREDYRDYVVEGCSEFCSEASDEQKKAFLILQPSEWGIYPCSECGRALEGEFGVENWCSDCDTKVKLRQAHQEIERLRSHINHPQTDEFFESLRIEAAHQREKWAETDPKKTDSDWFWLIGYLAGKAIQNNIDTDKKKHRVIAIAAVAFNWWTRTV